jgi:hypothetical protein
VRSSFSRRPLAGLIGRVTSYEGLGQKLSFGAQLAGAEASVEAAAQRSELAGKSSDELTPTEPSPLGREAEANPSFVVLQAWERLLASLDDLVGVALPNRAGRGPSVRWMPELSKREVVSSDFVAAVQALRDLRNRVAHGQHNPTPGEAIAYDESAQQLAFLARLTADFISRNPDLISGSA